MIVAVSLPPKKEKYKLEKKMNHDLEEEVVVKVC